MPNSATTSKVLTLFKYGIASSDPLLCIGCLLLLLHVVSQLLDVTVFDVEANPRKMCLTQKKQFET